MIPPIGIVLSPSLLLPSLSRLARFRLDLKYLRRTLASRLRPLAFVLTLRFGRLNLRRRLCSLRMVTFDILLRCELLSDSLCRNFLRRNSRLCSSRMTFLLGMNLMASRELNDTLRDRVRRRRPAELIRILVPPAAPGLFSMDLGESSWLLPIAESSSAAEVPPPAACSFPMMLLTRLLDRGLGERDLRDIVDLLAQWTLHGSHHIAIQLDAFTWLHVF